MEEPQLTKLPPTLTVLLKAELWFLQWPQFHQYHHMRTPTPLMEPDTPLISSQPQVEPKPCTMLPQLEPMDSSNPSPPSPPHQERPPQLKDKLKKLKLLMVLEQLFMRLTQMELNPPSSSQLWPTLTVKLPLMMWATTPLEEPQLPTITAPLTPQEMLSQLILLPLLMEANRLSPVSQLPSMHPPWEPSHTPPNQSLPTAHTTPLITFPNPLE